MNGIGDVARLLPLLRRPEPAVSGTGCVRRAQICPGLCAVLAQDPGGPLGFPMAEKNKGERAPWIRYSGIGIEFAAAVAGFTLVGYWIDRHYECGPWGVLIGAVLGLVGGMYNLIRQSLAAVRDAVRSSSAESDKDGESNR